MKAILRWVVLMLRLKVNFKKSFLMGVNVSSSFLGFAATFLHCLRVKLSFIYFGLSVGANPRKEATWKPVILDRHDEEEIELIEDSIY
jgi:hypothetical protein